MLKVRGFVELKSWKFLQVWNQNTWINKDVFLIFVPNNEESADDDDDGDAQQSKPVNADKLCDGEGQKRDEGEKKEDCCGQQKEEGRKTQEISPSFAQENCTHAQVNGNQGEFFPT